MKKLFSMTIVAALVAVVMLNTRSAQAGTPSTVLATILDRMTNASKQIHTLKANISQQKINTQIGVKGPIESGTLYYHPLKDGKSQLRIDYTAPDEKVLVVDGDKFSLYQPGLNQILKSSIQKYAKNDSAGAISLRIDANTLEKYNVSYEKDEDVDGVHTSVLAFIPKAGVASPFKRQDIWVDRDSWLPAKIQITEKNNDITWFRLGNLQQNIKLGNIFSIKTKPGTQTING